MASFNPFSGIQRGLVTPLADSINNLANYSAKQTLINQVNSSDSSLLTNDEKGTILGGLDYGNMAARGVTYEELKANAKKQYDAGVAEKNRQLQTQGKAAAILTGGRGVDFANQPLADGRQLRGVAGA